MQAEGRLTRRLARYWVFLVLAYAFGLFAFFYYGTINAFGSALSPTIGLINPRYLVSAIGSAYLTGFTIGAIFLGFDVRARDVRESIVEVLDSRPITNLELITGRFFGLLLGAWVPVIILVLLIQGLGWLLPLLGSPIGRPVEPVSLAFFLFMMALPGFAFCFAFVFLVTLLVRNRLVAALLSIAVLVGLYWATIETPAPLVPFFDYLGLNQVILPSDLVTEITRPGGWLQRFGFLVLALGFVGLAAAIHPCLDGGRRGLQGAVSGAILIVGLLMLAGAWQQRVSGINLIEQWRSAHAARANETFVQIRSMQGSIRIDPGNTIEVSLHMTVQAPADQDLNTILLTLNPGLQVSRVVLAGNDVGDFQFKDGLLDIKRSLAAGSSADLELTYQGAPNTYFAYLDSSLNLGKLKGTDSQIAILGYAPGIFNKRYVALMPGIHWLPAAGVDVGHDDTRKRPRDYFSLDLEVDVPPTWTVAGPGKREELGVARGMARFRYAPPVKLPEVALITAKFKSFAMDIDGITFEALVYPGHDSNFTVMADAGDEVKQWIQDHLDVARDAGLPYPFKAFTLVEAPMNMRGFKGGWRMDTSMAPPAMALVKESGFPTARFDFDLGNHFGNKRDYDQEGGKGRIDRDRLINYFKNDLSGGNIFDAAARSFFQYRTSALGPDSIAMNFTMEQLATLLLSGQRSYFSAHMFVSINQSVRDVVMGRQGRAGINNAADAVITVNTAKPEVWDEVLSTPLAEIDPWANPQRTIDVLTLKGGEMAQAIYDSMGAEDTGKFLAYILKQHKGGSYTRADVIAAGNSVSEDLGSIFNDWFNTTRLPGFVGDHVQLYRLPDNDNGDKAYQLLIRVRNDEPVAGFARVSWYMEAFGKESTSKPIRVGGQSAVEFGVVTSQPPVSVHLQPYLSLNREGFNVKILNQQEIPTRKAEPFNGTRDVPWDSGDNVRIIADDLDEGFSIISDGAKEGMRLAGRSVDTGMDQGLPLVIGPIIPSEWSRRVALTAWGRYRHTTAYIRAGSGKNHAVMPVTIPNPGMWELEIHIPWLQMMPQAEQRGTWNLDIVTENGRESVSFNAKAGALGWNLVGEYQLPAGEVRVEFSDKTDGRAVMADAIAWSPVKGQATAGN